LTTAGFSTEKEILMANKKSFSPLLAFGAYYFKIPTMSKFQ